MIYFSALLLSLLLTIVLIPMLVKLACRYGIVDLPGERKIHTTPVPRIGGVALALGFVVPLFLLQPMDPFILAYLAGAGMLVALGLVDDVRGVDYRIKFLVQLMAALVIVFYGGVRITTLGGLLPDGTLLPSWLEVALTLIVIVGVTNAVNLADGLDGLAGGLCFLCLSGIIYFAYLTEQQTILLLAVTLAGAVFGFLRYNTYPATLFMGDAGSLFLGFSMITLCLALTQGATPLSPLLPLLLLGLPVLDTMTVMAERISHGRSPFAADKRHIHHRIMALGFYHTESVFLIYLLQAVLIMAAVWFRYHDEWLILGAYLAFSGLVLYVFWLAGMTGWRVRRMDLVDRVIKGRLKGMVQAGLLAGITFRIAEYGLPILLMATCLIPAVIPGYFQILAGVSLGFLLVTFFWLISWLRGVLTVSLYLFVPLLVFAAITNTGAWMGNNLRIVYGAIFLTLLTVVILALKFSRRRRGFQVTPMDFLIMFLVFVVPILSGPYVKIENMGLIVAMTIMLFFSYEMLMGELRGNYNWLALSTMGAFGIVLVRGFLS